METWILEDFKKAVSDTWAMDGRNSWPVDINSIAYLFMDIFFNELMEDIERAKERGFGEKDISIMFKNPARLIRLIMPCVQGMNALKMPLKERRENLLRLLSMVKNLKHGDLCNRDMKNIVLSPAEVESTIDSSSMISAVKDSSIVIHRLCGILWAYTEAVCFRAHGLSKEFHGPYSHSDYKGEILIRDFHNLNALELWDDCRKVKYEQLRIVTVYEDIGLAIDIYNHLFIRNYKDYINSLKYYYFEGDGRSLSLDEANSLCPILYEVMVSIVKKIESMKWRRIAEKYADIFWYSKKELRHKLELDWRYPLIVKKRIEKGQLDTRFRELSQRDIQFLLRVAF